MKKTTKHFSVDARERFTSDRFRKWSDPEYREQRCEAIRRRVLDNAVRPKMPLPIRTIRTIFP
jgi:hypothetical protein